MCSRDDTTCVLLGLFPRVKDAYLARDLYALAHKRHTKHLKLLNVPQERALIYGVCSIGKGCGCSDEAKILDLG